MARELETVDGENWKAFTEAPAAVLVLGKTDCDNCLRYGSELTEFLATDREFGDVRFGKMMLDQRGLIDFKRANPWLAEVDALPFTVIYVGGERTKSFAGGGVDRLLSRLRRIGARA